MHGSRTKPDGLWCGQVGTANQLVPLENWLPPALHVTTNVMLTQQLLPHSKFSLSKVRPDAAATVAISPPFTR